MSNPVVLITGALTGIGSAAAVAFAKKGAKVVVAGRRHEAGKALVKELLFRLGGRVHQRPPCRVGSSRRGQDSPIYAPRRTPTRHGAGPRRSIRKSVKTLTFGAW